MKAPTKGMKGKPNLSFGNFTPYTGNIKSGSGSMKMPAKMKKKAPKKKK